MHDDVEEVCHDPIALRLAIGGVGLDAVIPMQGVEQLVLNRSQLGFAAGAGNHKEISDVRDFPHIEDYDVFGFLVFGQVTAKLGQLLGIHFPRRVVEEAWNVEEGRWRKTGCGVTTLCQTFGGVG